MIFPKLKPPKLTESTVSAFGGIDKNPICPENFFSDTKNTSARNFPLLSPRENRATLTTIDLPVSALHTVNGLTYTARTDLYYNGVLQYTGLTPYGKKQIVSMGSKNIVFPDGYYVNTLDVDENGVCLDKGYITKSSTFGDGLGVVLMPCVAGKTIPLTYKPSLPEDKQLYLDDLSAPNVLYEYSKETGEWTPIEATHTYIEIAGIDQPFPPNTTVKISGLMGASEGICTIVESGKDYIITDSRISNSQGFELSGDNYCTICEAFPQMDFVCEHQNRLFGCRYGRDHKGNFVNEIYASKLGDPGAWYEFNGLSTDSYAASCGSEGAFTGIISHMGYVVFFKENKIHRLFGTKPANFTLYEDTYPGVKKNSENSLSLLNGTVYYHGENGIYAYSGSSPALVSGALGKQRYSNASAAVCNGVYYICMTDDSGKRQLFTYDTFKGLWHREDGSDCKLMAALDGNVLAIKTTDGKDTFELLLSKNIPDLCRSVYGNSIKQEKPFEWYAESGNIGISIDNCKYLTKLKLRFEAPKGSTVKLSYMLDSSGVWEDCESLASKSLGIYTFNLCPPRCDHIKLRISGRGDCKIYSLTKSFEVVSEVM